MAESDSQTTIESVRQSIGNFHIEATNGYSDDNTSICSTAASRTDNWPRCSGRRQKRRTAALKPDVSKMTVMMPDNKSLLDVEDNTSENDVCMNLSSSVGFLMKIPLHGRKPNKRRQLEIKSQCIELSVNKHETIRRSKKRGKGRSKPPTIAQYFTHSASNVSLTSLNSSTSSGIDTADGSNNSTTSRDNSRSLFLNELQCTFQPRNCVEREDKSPSTISSTSSSTGFGDDDSEVREIVSECVENNDEEISPDVPRPISNEFKDFDSSANLFELNDFPTQTTSADYCSSVNSDIHNYLIHIPLNYYPILLKNFNAINQKQQRDISPLLSNPNVEKFYNEQREYYRRIYDKQFAACGSVVLKNKPCFIKLSQQVHSNDAQSTNIPSTKASTSTEVEGDYPTVVSPKIPGASWRRNYNNGNPFNKKSSMRSRFMYRVPYYEPHQHLGFPVRLPYEWQTLGLETPYYVTYWQGINEGNKKPQTYAKIHYTTVNDTPIYQHPEDQDGTVKNNTEPLDDENNNVLHAAETTKPEDDPVTMVDICEPIFRYSSDSSLDSILKLSDQILEFHQSVEQQPNTLGRKLNLRDMLYHTIAPIFPMCGLYIVGSSLNGFGNNKSDMDLCLMITNRDIDQRSDAVIVLQSIMRTLQTTSFVASQQLILAKVPILRIKFHSAFSDITVDLNANNSVAIRNTHLLCYYSSFDWRVRPLVAVVKEWAKRRGINDANRSSFTSYSLVLMVIHYLQCGVMPPVLPSLQQLYPKCFSQRADVRQLNVSLPLTPPPPTVWDFNDRLTLGELLIGFFQYYAFSFNFDTDAISIRLGRKTERALVARNRSPYNHLSQWHCICIEEPFTFSNTAHSVYDERVFNSIKQSFSHGFRQLEADHDLHTFLSSSSDNAPQGKEM